MGRVSYFCLKSGSASRFLVAEAVPLHLLAGFVFCLDSENNSQYDTSGDQKRAKDTEYLAVASRMLRFAERTRCPNVRICFPD